MKTKRVLTGLINIVAVCVIASLASRGLFVGKGNDDDNNNNNSEGTAIVETSSLTAALPAEGNATTHSGSTKMIELANGKKTSSSATFLHSQYAMRNSSKQSRRALKMGMGKSSSGTQSPTSAFIGTKSLTGKSSMSKGSKRIIDACISVDDFTSKSKSMMRSRKMMNIRLLEDMIAPAMEPVMEPAMKPQNTNEEGQSTRTLGMMGMKSSSDIFGASERSSSGGKMMGMMMGKSGSGGKTGKSKSKASVPVSAHIPSFPECGSFDVSPFL